MALALLWIIEKIVEWTMTRTSTVHVKPLEAPIFHVMFHLFYPRCDTSISSAPQSFPASFFPWNLSQGHTHRGAPHLPGKHYVVSGMRSMSATFLQSLLQLLEELAWTGTRALHFLQTSVESSFQTWESNSYLHWRSEIFLPEYTVLGAFIEKEKTIQIWFSDYRS